jgi:hypothetical protein
MRRYTVKMRHLLSKNMFFSALERTFTKEMTYEGLLEEKRIARIGSNDPESHLGIPCSHVSANITIKIRAVRYPPLTEQKDLERVKAGSTLPVFADRTLFEQRRRVH